MTLPGTYIFRARCTKKMKKVLQTHPPIRFFHTLFAQHVSTLNWVLLRVLLHTTEKEHYFSEEWRGGVAAVETRVLKSPKFSCFFRASFPLFFSGEHWLEIAQDNSGKHGKAWQVSHESIRVARYGNFQTKNPNLGKFWRVLMLV
jgi:hypothetical protein